MKVIIVGAGEVGFHIAGRLAFEKKDVVVIDTAPEAIKRATDNLDVQAILGSGTSPVILMEAGIETADLLLAMTDSDEANLSACLIADIISPLTKKLARIRNGDFDDYHSVLRNQAPHIDTVVNPEIEVVRTIERLMSMPGAVDVGEFADGRVRLVGMTLDGASRLAGARLSELPSRVDKQVPLIAAIVRDEHLIIPSGNDKLKSEDLVYFLCEKERLHDSLSIFGQGVQPLRRVLIVGGGRIGYRLASLLEKRPVQVKIVDKDPERCSELAERLDKAVVLSGDASDQDLLTEENIQEMDVVITLTGDEEINILVSLLARRMGAKKTITRISKFSYFPLMSTIGLEQVVSPRLSAINTILQHVRRGKVLSAISIKGEQAEVMKAVAPGTSAIVGKPLMKLALPKGVLVAGIMRKEKVIIPSGESVIEPNDRVIIFARRQAVPKMEKMLEVKLEYL